MSASSCLPILPKRIALASGISVFFPPNRQSLIIKKKKPKRTFTRKLVHHPIRSVIIRIIQEPQQLAIRSSRTFISFFFFSILCLPLRLPLGLGLGLGSRINHIKPRQLIMKLCPHLPQRPDDILQITCTSFSVDGGEEGCYPVPGEGFDLGFVGCEYLLFWI